MIGVPIGGRSQVLGYNESVVTSCSIPSITLKNNHNDIYYHRVRKALAAGVISLEHIPGKSNPYDLLIKPLGTHQHYPLIK